MDKMKHLFIIIILILALAVVFSIGYDLASKDCGLTDEQRSALPYLIDNMEHARDTHQDIVDDPERWSAWIKAGVDHQVWVDIYDEIIEILEAIN